MNRRRVYGSHPVYLFTFCFIWKYTYTTINKISRDKAYVCSKHLNPARWKFTEALEFSAYRSWACPQRGGRDVWGEQRQEGRGTGTLVGKVTVLGGCRVTGEVWKGPLDIIQLILSRQGHREQGTQEHIQVGLGGLQRDTPGCPSSCSRALHPHGQKLSRGEGRARGQRRGSC